MFPSHDRYGETQTEIDYSQVEKAILILTYQTKETLEPILCDVTETNIRYCVCGEALSKTGTIDGFLRLYSDNDQAITTSSFRFNVDENVLEDETISGEISLINQVLQDVASTDSKLNFNENERKINEEARDISEKVRINNENDREDSFTVLVAEVNAKKNELEDMMQNENFTNTASIRWDFDGFNDTTTDLSNDNFYMIPDGYKLKIISIIITSNGYNTSTGIDDTNFFKIKIGHSIDYVINETFTDLHPFPDIANKLNCAILKNDLVSDHSMTITTETSPNVSVNPFTIQMNYKLVEAEW